MPNGALARTQRLLALARRATAVSLPNGAHSKARVLLRTR